MFKAVIDSTLTLSGFCLWRGPPFYHCTYRRSSPHSLFHLRFLWLHLFCFLFLHAPFIPISYSISVHPGLPWSMQSLNHRPCPSTSPSFWFSQIPSRSLCQKALQKLKIFSRVLCLSTSPLSAQPLPRSSCFSPVRGNSY